MSGTKRAFEILEVLHGLKEASRMDIFQSFDGTVSFNFVKRALGFLSSEKLVESVLADVPNVGSIWRLTDTGKAVIEDWAADAETEEVPRR